MPPLNPTEEQLKARLNPTPVNITTPTSAGLFRAKGDFGSAVYRRNADGTYDQFNVSGYGRSKLIEGRTPDQYGNYNGIPNAGGQAEYGLSSLKSQYGFDYNSLPEFNTADMGNFTLGGKTINDPSSFFQSTTTPTSQTSTINNTPNALATPEQIAEQMKNPLWNAGSQGKSPIDLVTSIQNQNNPYPSANLQPGATGSEVKKLQDYLVSQGLMTREQVNTGYGTYGPQTTAAVKALQEKLGVDNSTGVGYFGPKTIAAIQGQGGGTNATTGTTGSQGGTSGGAPAYSTSTQARNETREQGIARQKAELEAGLTEPAPFKSAEEFKKLREEKGVVADEEELSSIQNEARLAKEELNQFKQTSSKEISQGGYLGGISEAERNMNFRLSSLALRESAVVDRLNNKNSYINTVIGLGKDDYTTAKAAYDDEYNKNVKAIDMYNTELDEQQRDALSGFTTMANLLKESGMSTLTPQLSNQLDSLALKAGLPTGVFQQALKGISAQEKIDNMKVVGNNVYMWTTDAQGNPHLKLVQTVSDGKTVNTPTINPEYKGVIDTILGSGKFTEAQATAVRNAIGGGEDPLTVVKNQAKNIMGQSLATDLDKAETALSQLQSIDAALKDFYAKGGETGVFTGNFEKTLNKLGQVQDPKLVGMATEIALAMQAYRLAVTGTAASVQEDARIDNVFPGITSGEVLNNARTKATIASFQNKIDSSYRNTLGSAYDTLKGMETSSSNNTSFSNPEWMADYSYDRDIQYAREAIEAGADKAQVEAVLKQKYLNVQL